MISFRQSGSFSKTEKFLKKTMGKDYLKVLEQYAQKGVEALSAGTPIESGETASSWYYQIIKKKDSISITWNNSNVNKGVNIAIILQYGHATRGGGYVEGRDYINPALRPVFDDLADKAWKAVTKV